MPGKIFPFRLYAQILIFSGLVALGVLILFSLQRAIQGGVALVRDDLITMLEQRIGRKIHYSSISPSIFGSFDVRNVSITGTDDHPVLTVSRFRIAYSLWDLLRKRPQAIHTVRIDTPLINFDTVRDNDLINLFQNLSAGGNGSPDNLSTLFPNRLMVRIRNGKCLVYREGDQFEFEALNLNVEVADKRMILDGKWDISYTINGLMGSPVSLQAEMMLSGSCRTDMEEGEAVLSIPAITGDAQSASPIAFGLVLEDRIIRVGKMPDNLSMDFSLMYALDNENMDARLECSNFRMGEFFSFHGGLDGVRQFLDIAGSGTASFERGNDGALAYSVDLTGSTPSAGSRPYRVAGASFRIDAEGDEKNAHISALRFSTPQFGNASFRGDIGLSPFAPEGVLSFDNFSLSGAESLSADISIKTSDADSGREIGLFSKALRLSQVYLNDFKALLRPSDDDIDFTVSALRSTNADSGSNSVGTGAVKTAGSFVLKGNMNMRPRRIEAKLRLDSFFAGDIAGMALPFTAGALVPPLFKGLLDGTAITTEAFFATDFSTMSYNAPGFAFNNKAGKGVSGLVSLSGTNRRIDLNHGRFTWGDDHLSLSGKAEFDGPKNINFSVQTDYRNIGYFVEGEITDGNSINIRGSNGLELILTTSGNRGYAGSLRAEGFPVPFLGRPAFVSFAAQIRYDAESSWSVNLEQFDLANISGPSGLAQIRIRGNIDQNGAKFPLLYYQDNLSPLSGMAEFSWAEHFTGSASMWNGRESYHLGGIHADDRSSFSFSGSSMRLERIFGGKFSALADGSVDLVWNSFDSFRAEMNLTSVSGKLYNQEFGAKARAVLDNGELTVSGLSFSYAGLQGAVPRFILSAAKGMVETSISVQGLAIERPIEGGLSLEASFTPLRSWLEIKEALSSFDGKIHFENIIYGVGGETQNFDINFSGSDGIFMVSGGPRNMIRFRMDGEGNFFGGLSSPFPVRGTIAGSINKKIINAHCTDLYVDLAELYALLPITPHDFYLTGGYVNASLDIRGSLTDPEFFGSARGTSLQIRIPNYISKELRPIPFSVAIEGNEMRFGPVDAAVGTGAGKVSGWFLIDRWIPNIFSIDIAVPRETPVPYGLDLSGFTARGDISGNMNISMENQTYDISGEVFANNSALGVNYEEITSPRNRIPFSGVKTPFIVNVKVTTGPVVEFFYPSSRFPVLRANPDMGTVFYVTADSTTRQYSLNGDIKIRSGEIFYFERSFYIRSGVLAFHENELKFAPRLTARAEVRDRTEDGPVTISMFVENAPLLSFTARFESSPPLSQMEILALMGQSITGNQYNETNDSIQRAFLSSTSDLLAQFVLVRQLEQQIRSFTRLDMFSVRTQVIQNAIFMATGLIQQPVDRIATVGNYFDNTTVFGGKYIGQDMFVQGMLSMRYDANRTSLGGLTFAPDFGVELQNPLFSIRWDFNPAHPENWFVNDNSITLTWNKTF